MDNPPWSADAASSSQTGRRLATAVWVAAIVLILGALWLVTRWEPIGMDLQAVADGGRTLQVIPHSKDDCDVDVRVSVVEETPDKVVLTASQERFLLPNFGGQACGALAWVDVPLQAPLGTRKIVDAQSGQEVTAPQH